MIEYHQDEWAEEDANGRKLIYPGPDGIAYVDGRPYGVVVARDCFCGEEVHAQMILDL